VCPDGGGTWDGALSAELYDGARVEPWIREGKAIALDRMERAIHVGVTRRASSCPSAARSFV